MTTKPTGLEYHLLGDWVPCTKIKYTEVGAIIALSKIKASLKYKHKKRRRKETRSYYCKECDAYHLTSAKYNNERNQNESTVKN